MIKPTNGDFAFIFFASIFKAFGLLFFITRVIQDFGTPLFIAMPIILLFMMIIIWRIIRHLDELIIMIDKED